MGRNKVTFEEVSEAFEKAKGILEVDANLKPVAGDDTKCCVVRGDAVQIESLSAMKSALSVLQTLMG